MNRREITRHGWTAQDELRAERMRAKHGVLVFDEVDPVPWRQDPTPYLVAGADILPTGMKVSLYRVTSQRTEGDQP